MNEPPSRPSRRAILAGLGLIPLGVGAGVLPATPAAAAPMGFDAWLGHVNGRLIDIDGYPSSDPYQCWDLWSHYAQAVHGVPSAMTYTNAGRSTPHGGYACNVHHNAQAAGLGQWFSAIGVGPAQRGDVAFWEMSGAFPGSHVAVVVEDRGSALYTMSQNKGPGHDPAGYQLIGKGGLLGLLRPKTSIIIDDKANDMRLIWTTGGKGYLVTPNGVYWIEDPYHYGLWKRLLMSDPSKTTPETFTQAEVDYFDRVLQSL